MTVSAPGGLGAGGEALWRGLSRSSDDPSTAALVVEAARAKDRLDRMSELTAGDIDAWARLMVGDAGVMVKLDGVVSEQRQLATVFRQLLSEIQRRQGDSGAVNEEDGLAGL